MCVHCLVKLLVRAAIGQNYPGSECVSRNRGLELEADTGAINGIGKDDDSRWGSGNRRRPPGVLVSPQARARVVVGKRRRQPVS